MVHASTQQAVDRVVGTAAVIGLSVVLVRWLSNPSSTDLLEEEEGVPNTRRRGYRRVPWFWPVIAMQRWNKQKHSDKNSEPGDGKMHKEEIIQNNSADYEHHGSCHCGSIKFVLQGPKHLQAVDSPGKIRYPHIPTSANKFQLVCGESDMRFYYEDENDDSSSITFEHAGEERLDGNEASGAHVFCGNCGVHVFHADRSTGELMVNANCLDGGGETKLMYRGRSLSWGSSISSSMHRGKLTTADRSQSSLSSAMEADNANDVEQLSKIETVSENEPFLGSALHSQHDNNNSTAVPRKDSVSSGQTQWESYSTTMAAENDDLSMGSSSITGASMPMYHSSLSVASGVASTHDRTDRAGFPPLPPPRLSSSDRMPPSRILSSNRSVKTLPPNLGDRPGYLSRRSRDGIGSGWSVTSMESSDLDGANEMGNTAISPRMRDQMKKYMSRHMSHEEGK